MKKPGIEGDVTEPALPADLHEKLARWIAVAGEEGAGLLEELGELRCLAQHRHDFPSPEVTELPEHKPEFESPPQGADRDDGIPHESLEAGHMKDEEEMTWSNQQVNLHTSLVPETAEPTEQKPKSEVLDQLVGVDADAGHENREVENVNQEEAIQSTATADLIGGFMSEASEPAEEKLESEELDLLAGIDEEVGSESMEMEDVGEKEVTRYASDEDLLGSLVPDGAEAPEQMPECDEIQPAWDQEDEPEQRNTEVKEMGNAEVPYSTSQVNLLTNLIRWVSEAKREVGVEQLPIFLDTYAISGHLAPELRKVIIELAQAISEEAAGPVELDRPDAWSRLILELHGIIAGGGSPLSPPESFFHTHEETETEPEEMEPEGSKGENEPLGLKLVLPAGSNGQQREFRIALTTATDGETA